MILWCFMLKYKNHNFYYVNTIWVHGKLLLNDTTLSFFSVFFSHILEITFWQWHFHIAVLFCTAQFWACTFSHCYSEPVHSHIKLPFTFSRRILNIHSHIAFLIIQIYEYIFCQKISTSLLASLCHVWMCPGRFWLFAELSRSLVTVTPDK